MKFSQKLVVGMITAAISAAAMAAETTAPTPPAGAAITGNEKIKLHIKKEKSPNGPKLAALGAYHTTDVWVDNHSTYPVSVYVPNSDQPSTILETGETTELWSDMGVSSVQLAVYSQNGVLIFNATGYNSVPSQATVICKDSTYGPGNQYCYLA